MIRATLFTIALAGPLHAGQAVVEDANATLAPDGQWRVDVTISHGDTGWDHYADGWFVETETGEKLGYRELLHPHVNEQPFTRSLGGVEIPEGTDRVFIRARDSVHGLSDDRFEVFLTD